MAIRIRFIEQPDSSAKDIAVGEIAVNGFRERLEIPLGFWTRQDYERQWKEGIDRIKNQSCEKSCLITARYDPAHANFIVWWPIYRVLDRLVVQHEYLFLDQLERPFDPVEPYSYIGTRQVSSSSGEPVSEWEVTES